MGARLCGWCFLWAPCKLLCRRRWVVLPPGPWSAHAFWLCLSRDDVLSLEMLCQCWIVPWEKISLVICFYFPRGMQQASSFSLPWHTSQPSYVFLAVESQRNNISTLSWSWKDRGRICDKIDCTPQVFSLLASLAYLTSSTASEACAHGIRN